MLEERKIEDAGLLASGGRQRLDDLRSSGSVSWNGWATKVRELDRVAHIASSKPLDTQGPRLGEPVRRNSA